MMRSWVSAKAGARTGDAAAGTAEFETTLDMTLIPDQVCGVCFDLPVRTRVFLLSSSSFVKEHGES